VKIISKYVLREHFGPFTFALTALTALMLLNFISRQFGELVGKGLPASAIGEFFLLSVPFTVALTVPMSVLVAVLYAFSRLAAENEVTALKASGVSPWRLVSPAIGGGILMSLALLAFNDQVLPRANHRLKTLQDDISQAKPTFLLKDQVINPIAEGKFYLKAGKIDRAGGRMREVVIYDLADPMRRRTIYADSGRIHIAANRKDLDLDLYHGQMQEVSTDRPAQLNRLFYDHDRIRIRDVARDFKKTASDSSSKGDREMGVCEMQRRFWYADAFYRESRREYAEALKPRKQDGSGTPYDAGPPSTAGRSPEPRGIGWLYCRVIGMLGVRTAHAAGIPTPLQQRDSAAPARSSTATAQAATPEVTRSVAPAAQFDGNAMRTARAAEAKLRLELSQRSRNRYDIEIHKKFSLAAACLIFVLLGAPIAVRFPRGGVGLVIGVSLFVFALYYVGLIGGESLANEALVPPFWAMWGTNVILMAVGVVLLVRMGKDSSSGRGGDWGDRIDALRARFRRKRRLRGPERRRTT
jgi:lipopolysaccharide export system permease protein